jgi:rubrerythrin
VALDNWELGGKGEQMDDQELSRGDVLLKGALALGALYGAGAVSPYVQRALAANAKGDVGVLNFLLPFEYIQVSLYNRGNSGENYYGEKLNLKGEEKELAELLVRQEGQHVAALKELIEELGGKPVDKGSYAFAYLEYGTWLQLGASLEASAIGAYNGAIPSLESEEARELAFSIVQVEGRHAAMVRIPNKEEPAPEAFDIGLTEDSAINSLVPFTGEYAEE